MGVEALFTASSSEAMELQDREAELKLQENFYKEQLARIERKNKEIYKMTTEQYQEAATKAEERIKKERRYLSWEEQGYSECMNSSGEFGGSFKQAVQTEIEIGRKRNADPVCVNLQSEILKCFRENKSEVLNCSELAKEYQRCVSAAQKLLTNLLSITDKGKPTTVKALGLVCIRKSRCNKLRNRAGCHGLHCRYLIILDYQAFDEVMFPFWWTSEYFIDRLCTYWYREEQSVCVAGERKFGAGSSGTLGRSGPLLKTFCQLCYFLWHRLLWFGIDTTIPFCSMLDTSDPESGQTWLSSLTHQRRYLTASDNCQLKYVGSVHSKVE
ncbi:hypothetical protein TURU_054611 [Turdus rufiventris]|nr:hypothetical protein TURU_054611 [Turdus rufiventris]